MRKRLILLTLVAPTLILGVAPVVSAVTTVKDGSPCKKNAIGQTAVVARKVFTCTKVGKKTIFKAAPIPAASSSASSSSRSSTGPIGSWKAGAGSVAGYRVQELFAGKPAKNPAVGRTAAVTGGLTIADSGSGLVVKDIKIDVDLTKLESDQSRRDGVLQGRGLEISKFPNASFSAPEVALPADAAKGGPINVTAKGKLTLHGVTKDIEFPLQAQLANGALEVVGTDIAVLMGDYGIDPPSVGGFVTVDDHGTLEFKLVFNRA